ncbi:HtaA domain-containing protein [Streptomyces sp. NPDC020965]|uniref:HtaA domain-containing protein n=1 Tax=Streptomyces sp. NPDC020965 TaxID=3365105 RepID=UPI0037B63A4A
MSTFRTTRLAALAALTAVSMGTGVLAAPAFAAPVAPAAADPAPVAPKAGTATASSPILITGQAGWGFKASWYRYITGPARGTVTVADGATKAADGVISYPVKHGAVNPTGLDADVRFAGSVTYAAPAHKITGITLANPRVELVDGKGTLFLDVTSAVEGAAPTTTKAVPFATLTATAGALKDSRLDWNGISAALTAEGAKTFAFDGDSMYEPGEVLDTLAVNGTATTPALTVSQVSGLGAETQVTVTGTGYRPGRGLYLAQTVALPGNTYPSVFGNAAYVRQVGADGTFTTTLKLTETFVPAGGAGGATTDCRTTACFVVSFNSHDGQDQSWMASRAQDVARNVLFGSAAVTTAPKSRTVRSGASTTFTAAAKGADAVQWERSTDRGTTWTPVAGATSGSLSVKATAAVHNSRYRAVFTNAAGSVASSSATLTVTAVPSRITGFNAAPEPVAKGGKLTLTGTLQTAGATDDTWRPLAKGAVVIEFRTKGGTTWTKATSATTGSQGTFSVTATATKDGDWRARYAGTPDRAASVGSGDTVDVKLRTEIAGFNAKPEPVRKGKPITVTGTLRSLDGTWKATSGQSLTILFKADGAKTWTKQSTTRTNSKGVFSKAFTAKKDGSWKAEFKATSVRLGSSSGSDRVDVR